MRGLLGRGAAPRAHSTSARRATRPLASVRIRLRTSGTRISHQRSLIEGKGKEEGVDTRTRQRWM